MKQASVSESPGTDESLGQRNAGIVLGLVPQASATPGASGVEGFGEGGSRRFRIMALKPSNLQN